MTKHTKSFLLSLSIHLLLAATLFYGYTQVASLNAKSTEEKEKRICIKLGKVTSQKTQAAQKIKTAQKDLKKVVKKKPKKVLQKKIKKIKKKVPLKKKIVKKEPPKEIIKHTKIEEPVKNIPKEIKQEKALEDVVLKKKELLPESKKEDISKEDCPHICCDTSVSKEEVYKSNNLSKIAKLLQENLYYPRRARKRGIEGKVVVRFVLQKDATVSNVEVVSSKSAVLSRGAVKTIENLSKKFPKPEEALTLTVPISYYLSD